MLHCIHRKYWFILNENKIQMQRKSRYEKREKRKKSKTKKLGFCLVGLLDEWSSPSKLSISYYPKEKKTTYGATVRKRKEGVW